MKLLGCICCWKMAPNSKMTRKWEVFAGRNKFYCDGYLMSAPNTGIFYLTVFLISGTSALFFAFDCPYLTIHITSAIPIVGAVLYVFTMCALLRTTFTDPGVIPRALQDEASYIEQQIEVPNSLNNPTYRPPPRTKEILVKGQTVKLKYCFTCKIFRPPRASHCSLCDNCVDRFDHHCPWVGNCVGKRNYRFFYMFIVSLAFLAVFIFSCSVTHLVLYGKEGNDEFIEIVKKNPFSVIVTLICFFSIWSVIGLAGFHTYLTTSNQTTNEDIKGSFSKGAQQIKNPYSHGNICSNCCYILCGPMAPSLIDRRGEATEEYISDMQSPECNRYNQSAQSIVLQPMSNNTHIQKTKYYESEIENNMISNNKPGKRERSYDNLKTANSTSVANLVENENPTSIQSVPINDDMLPSIDTDNLENLTPFNNMKGSYNNLFCDNLDNETNQMIGQTDSMPAADQLLENVYCNVSPIKQKSTSLIIGGKNANELSSPTIDNQMTNNIVDSILAVSDPNLHVYSNVNSTPITKDNKTMASQQQQQQQQQQLQPLTNLTSPLSLKPMLSTTAPSTVPPATATILINENSLNGNIESIINQSMLRNSNSKLLSNNLNDLDLDDPTLVTNLIANQPNTSIISKNNESISGHGTDKFNLSSRKLKKSSTVDVSSTSMRTKLFNDITTTSTADPMIDCDIGNNNSFFDAQRLRSLHDTTMIDTALDLDSLEDTNIGINSQSCLTK